MPRHSPPRHVPSAGDEVRPANIRYSSVLRDFGTGVPEGRSLRRLECAGAADRDTSRRLGMRSAQRTSGTSVLRYFGTSVPESRREGHPDGTERGCASAPDRDTLRRLGMMSTSDGVRYFATSLLLHFATRIAEGKAAPDGLHRATRRPPCGCTQKGALGVDRQHEAKAPGDGVTRRRGRGAKVQCGTWGVDRRCEATARGATARRDGAVARSRVAWSRGRAVAVARSRREGAVRCPVAVRGEGATRRRGATARTPPRVRPTSTPSRRPWPPASSHAPWRATRGR